MTKDEALRLALEALEWQQEMLYTAMQYSAAKGMTFLGHPPNPNEAITAIKAALEAKDESVAKYSDIISDGGFDPRNQFDVPPQRTWVGLTHAEIDYQAKKDDHGVYFALGALWAEAKLKEKTHD